MLWLATECQLLLWQSAVWSLLQITQKISCCTSRTFWHRQCSDSSTLTSTSNLTTLTTVISFKFWQPADSLTRVVDLATVSILQHCLGLSYWFHQLLLRISIWGGILLARISWIIQRTSSSSFSSLWLSSPSIAIECLCSLGCDGQPGGQVWSGPS